MAETGSRKRRPRIWEESSDDEKDKELLIVSNQQAIRKESLLAALADQFAGETNEKRADVTKVRILINPISTPIIFIRIYVVVSVSKRMAIFASVLSARMRIISIATSPG